MDYDLHGLGRRLRAARQRRNLSQETLGELAGLNPKYIGQLERERKNPTVAVLIRLAVALDVDSHVLLGEGVASFDRKQVIDSVAAKCEDLTAENLMLLQQLLRQMLAAQSTLPARIRKPET